MLITYQREISHEIQTLRLTNQFVHEFGILSMLKIHPSGDPYEYPFQISHAHKILGIFGKPKSEYIFSCNFIYTWG